MIQSLATRYSKTIACSLASLFYASMVLPVYGRIRSFSGYHPSHAVAPVAKSYRSARAAWGQPKRKLVKRLPAQQSLPVVAPMNAGKKLFIDGPGQPEMASFKPIGSDNLVNLFTGDFSYNIPLLDVGGYPVNIFYSGGIGVEQEASWVGLGWNINPGNINRNMRGVPDDFNGEDELIQKQNIKPNITWGGRIGADAELVGIKTSSFFSLSAGASLGLAYNNYLGPVFDFGFKGSAGFKIAQAAGSEKSAMDSLKLKAGVNLGGNISSRYGFTLSPSLSLSATAFKKDRELSGGLSLGTSFNSRNGIKDLQLNGQLNLSRKKSEIEMEKDGTPNVKSYRSTIGGLFSTSISFARPSYIPSIRMPMTNDAWSARAQLGGGIFGVYASGEAEVYRQSSSISDDQVRQVKPLVGYMYYEKALNNPNAVMDFTRLNDKEVTPTTPIISAPQYTYDIFYIQGEGTGGSIRAYRDDLGYVRDNFTGSKESSWGIGVDIGIPGHYGANGSMVHTPTTVGEWGNGNNLKSTMSFGTANGLHENVYFRNPGETSVLNDNQFSKIAGTDLVRFQLAGSGDNPRVEPVLERFSAGSKLLGTLDTRTAPVSNARKKRTQVISFLTAAEAAELGLDRKIRTYNRETVLDDVSRTLNFYNIERVSGYRKAHHISQINVTEGDGKRYVYGIPVYNKKQVDFTFTVSATVADTGKVGYSPNDTLTKKNENPHLSGGTGSKDGYIQISETPAYAHSFLLSGLLSPDYVDITGDGISEDDLGTAVKFNYSCIGSGNVPSMHKWRTPADKRAGIASFNPGNRTETKDDKAIVSYGERESWYVHSIESKTMIALFTLEDRLDGKGPTDVYNGIDVNDNTSKRLKQIDLYNKADLKKNGLTGANKAKPIKTVHFEYSYALCKSTPDNVGNVTGMEGKLTLEGIYFTYNGQQRINKDRYVFSYTNGATGNPGYAYNATDRWGTYKPSAMNPDAMENSDYPYSLQNVSAKNTIDENAGAWSLRKILLPSGGQLEVNYETDDYAYVQNKRAAAMMQVVGFGNSNTAYSNRLFDVNDGSVTDNDYLFIRVPVACSTKREVYFKYLQGIDQLAVKLGVHMPRGPELEYINAYATFNNGIDGVDNFGVYATDPGIIWIKMTRVEDVSPLSLAAVEYLREQLPGQAFKGYDVSDKSGWEQVGQILGGWWDALKTAFSDPVNVLRSDGKTQYVKTERCFVRLNDPDGCKYGGGQRVKSVRLKDNWQAMTQQYTSVYGQDYTYTTTEVVDGQTKVISSGVASYEPGIGSEENPFQRIVQVANSLPMGPTSYGAIEMPILDAFFPAPTVGYSKVTVKSIPSVTPAAGQKTRSGIGRQVTEFYTAKDFPVQYAHTSFDAASDKQSHRASLMAFFYKYAFDYRTLSQGFLVATNDMHGKMKSQSSYAENDTTLRVNYTENFYRNTGNKGLEEKFDFVHSARSGDVLTGNLGIDIELMTDVREFTVSSNSYELQLQVDLFPVLFPFWIPFPWPVVGESENIYRAVTTTKVINYHGVLDSVSVTDKGSQVGTKNMLLDAETGNVIVNRTNNEFRKPVYTTNYPAYWAYSGMGLAYKNTGALFSGINFLDGRIVNAGFDQSVFESGDEVVLTKRGTFGGNSCNWLPNSAGSILYVFNVKKNETALSAAPDFVFLDDEGTPFNGYGASFKVIRSGKRNLLTANVAAITSLSSPIVPGTPNAKLFLGSDSKVISASAQEYREKWRADQDLFARTGKVINPENCEEMEVFDCSGVLPKKLNPYRYGFVGNFKPYRSMVYYGDRKETDPAVVTNLPVDGTLDAFKSYWLFDGNNNLVPDITATKWVWNSRVTNVNAKGMELETQNALNIFTSAQYGYSKSLPVAITNNSRSAEAGYEGFEDLKYYEKLSAGVVHDCDYYHQLGFHTLANASVVSADSLGFNAHTGKYVLAVQNGTTVTKRIPIATTTSDSFNLKFGRDTLRSPGFEIYNVAPMTNYPVGLNTNIWDKGAALISTVCDIYGYDTMYHAETSWPYQEDWGYYSSSTISSYFDVLESGTHTFQTGVGGYNTSEPGGGYMSFRLTQMDDTEIPAATSYANTPYANGMYYTYCLPKGRYKIVCDFGVSGDRTWYEGHIAWSTPNYLSSVIFNIDHFGPAANVYANLETYDLCSYTTPMAPKDSLFNSSMAIVSGKEMLFSAWVRENCWNDPGTPCRKISYDSNYVVINGAPQPLKAAGPVIDGWQRYEGKFNATGSYVDIQLVNTSNKPVYFDDIRIHPFNANMKSYVYDPVTLRLTAELDANNYATFYEYDEEGTLIRTKAETREGIKTITETRSSKQKTITTIQ